MADAASHSLYRPASGVLRPLLGLSPVSQYAGEVMIRFFKNWQPCLSLITAGLLVACVGSFPATDPGMGPLDLDLGVTTADSTSPEPPEPPRPDMMIPPPPPSPPVTGAEPDAAVDSSLPCAQLWPDVCGVPCAGQGDDSQLLHITRQEIFELPAGSHRYRCVVIAGTLKIRGSTQIEAESFTLKSTGKIDGLGAGDGGPGQGSNGVSRDGRGSGGAGGSGLCRGGNGSPLVGRAGPPAAGSTQLDLSYPGGPGGQGGSGTTPRFDPSEGRPGGRGGASLQIRGEECQVSGQINQGGLPGEDGRDASHGGGGGGAAGNLQLECSTAQFFTRSLSIYLEGGDGGRGGSALNLYAGGGGGGGAGGGFRVVTRRALVNGAALAAPGLLISELFDYIHLDGGEAGDRGTSGPSAERGAPGGPCRSIFEPN